MEKVGKLEKVGKKEKVEKIEKVEKQYKQLIQIEGNNLFFCCGLCCVQKFTIIFFSKRDGMYSIDRSRTLQ